MKQKVINIKEKLEEQTLKKIQEQFSQGDIFSAYVTLADFLNRLECCDNKFLLLKANLLEYSACYELLFETASLCMIEAIKNKKLFTRNDIFDIFKSLVELDQYESLRLFIEYNNFADLFEKYEKNKIKSDKNYIPYFDRRRPSNIESKEYDKFQDAFSKKAYEQIIDANIKENSYFNFDLQLMQSQACLQVGNVAKAQEIIHNLQNKTENKDEYIFYSLYNCHKVEQNKEGMEFYINKLLFLSRSKRFLHNFQSSLLNELVANEKYDYALELVDNFLTFEQMDSYLLAYKCIILSRLNKIDELKTGLETLDIICNNDKTAYFMLKELQTKGTLSFDMRFELSQYMKSQVAFLFKQFLDLTIVGDDKKLKAFLNNNFNFNAVAYICLNCKLSDDEFEKVVGVKNEKLNKLLLSIIYDNNEPFEKKFQVIKSFSKTGEGSKFYVIHEHFISEVCLLPNELLKKQSNALYEAYYEAIMFIFNNKMAKPLLSYFLNLCVDIISNCVTSKNIQLLNDKKALLVVMLTLYFNACYEIDSKQLFKEIKNLPFDQFDNYASQLGIELKKKQLFINGKQVDIHQKYFEYVQNLNIGNN